MNKLEEVCREVLCKDCSRKPVQQVRNIKEVEQVLHSLNPDEMEENDEWIKRCCEWFLFKREKIGD
jgi:hypothetical protein